MTKLPFLTLVLAIVTAASCAIDEPRVYRGGQRIYPAPLGVEDHYSYRFVERWRISHNWLSGPVDLRGCSGYSLNPYRLRLVGGPLSSDMNAPFIEYRGSLYLVSEHKGVWSLSDRREKIDGTDPTGKFERFSPFCVHFFGDSMDGVGLYIVKPAPTKGTDAWIEGAETVIINGLAWLHKKDPIRDWSQSRVHQAGPIERWVLKIPDTQYWLYLSFASSTGATSMYGTGALAYPEKHARLLELFHQIVASVKLEPIEPIDLGHLIPR